MTFNRRWPIARAIAFLVLWLILAGPGLYDLPIGVVAAAAAAWASQRLMPNVRPLASFPALVWFLLQFLRQSILAGWQVARLAFDPKLELRSGFVVFSPRLEGYARNLFSAVSSMVPGNLPAGSTQDGDLLVHALDTRQSVIESMTVDEARLSRVLGAYRPGAST